MSEELMGIDSDLPEDLPMLPVTDLLDDYLGVLHMHVAELQDATRCPEDASQSIERQQRGSSELSGAGGIESQTSQDSRAGAGAYSSYITEEDRFASAEVGPAGEFQHLLEGQPVGYLPPIIRFDTVNPQGVACHDTSATQSPGRREADCESLQDWGAAAAKAAPVGESSAAVQPATALSLEQNIFLGSDSAHDQLLPQQLTSSSPQARQVETATSTVSGDEPHTNYHQAYLDGSKVPEISEDCCLGASATADYFKGVMDAYKHTENDCQGPAHAASTGQNQPRRRRSRSERQQMLNKFAQQRYRERKKQKAIDTERAAAELASKMESYEIIRSKYWSLDSQRQALRERLASQDAELASLSSVDAVDHMEETPSRKGAISDGLADQAAELLSSKKVLHGKIIQLNEYLDRHCKLQASHLVTTHSPKSSMESLLKPLIEEIMALSLHIQWLQGSDIWHTIGAPARQVSRLSDCNCTVCEQKSTWTDVAATLQLTQSQRRKLSNVGLQYSKKLNYILAERQGLNIETIAIMLPQGWQIRGSQQLTRQESTYSYMSFFQRAHHTAKVTEVLDRLKQNLREEQRAASELEYILFHRILNLVQSSRLLLGSYPSRCNILALANAAQQLNDGA